MFEKIVQRCGRVSAKTQKNLFAAVLFAFSPIAGALEAGALQKNIEMLSPPVDPLPPVSNQKLPPAYQPKVDPNAVRVLVTAFKFEGATLFSDDELQAVVKPWIGKELALVELQQVADVVSNFYQKNGRLAQVLLPPQKLTGGVVILKIVEAKLGAVNIRTEDDPRFSPKLALKFVTDDNDIGELVNTDSIQRAIFLLSEVPGVTASTEIEPGTNDGEIALNVNVRDTQIANAKFDINNYGSRSTGQIQGDFMVSVNDPLGIGDQIILSGIGSQGTGYGLVGYSVPLLYNSLRMGVTANQLDYRNVGSFEANGSYGHATVGSAYLSYALHRSESANANLLLSYDQKWYMNRSIATTAISSNYIIRDLNLSISANNFDDFLGGGINSGQLSLTQGNLSFFADQYANGPNTYGQYTPKYYNKLTFMAARTQQIIQDETLLSLTLTGQLANQNLDPAEKFYLGGVTGVQAYPVGQGGGSQGALAVANLEQRFPENITGLISAQYGVVQQYVNPYEGWQGLTNAGNVYSLAGFGPGIRYKYQRLTLTGSLAWAIGKNPLKSNTGQSVNVDNWSPPPGLQPAYGWFQATLTF